MDRNATPITIPELDLLNLSGFLRSPPLCKIYYYTRFLRVYVETLTMSSQEPPKKKSEQVENKQGTLLSWVKPCTSDPEPGVVEETIRIKEQPGNENDLEPSTTIAGRQEATKRQLSPPDLVYTSRRILNSRQRPSGVRIQQKDHFKQHGLNNLSGCIMTRDEMLLIAILA